VLIELLKKYLYDVFMFLLFHDVVVSNVNHLFADLLMNSTRPDVSVNP
jgi:hypothetical protein